MGPTAEKAVTRLTGTHCRHFNWTLRSTMSGRYRIYMKKRTWRKCFHPSGRQRCSPMQRTGFQGPTEKKMNENVRPAENLVHECMGELRRRRPRIGGSRYGGTMGKEARGLQIKVRKDDESNVRMKDD